MKAYCVENGEKRQTCPTCGQASQVNLSDERSDGSFESEFFHWLIFLKATGTSAHHRRNLKSYAQNHILPTLGNLPPGAITTRVIHNLYLGLLQKGLASKSVKHVLSTVRGLLNHLYRLDGIERIPHFPQIRVVAKEKAWLDQAGQAAILAQCESKYLMYFRILMETGIRPGECRGLKLKDFVGSRISVSRALDENGFVRPTKTGRIYRFQISDQLEAEIQRRYAAHHPEAFLFAHKRTALQNAWRAACDRAGLRIPMYQAARHSRASQINAECDAYRDARLKEALQHESVATTKRFYALDASRRLEVQKSC
jgi:integrase